MIFDVEALLLARLAAKCAPGSLLLGTFDPIDLTDDTTTPVVAQIQIAATEPTAATGKNLRLGVVYSVNVFLDTARADAGEKAAAATCSRMRSPRWWTTSTSPAGMSRSSAARPQNSMAACCGWPSASPSRRMSSAPEISIGDNPMGSAYIGKAKVRVALFSAGSTFENRPFRYLENVSAFQFSFSEEEKKLADFASASAVSTPPSSGSAT
jgi:hypothetical protein